MLRKLLASALLFLALLPFSASAFTNSECTELAEQLFAAQSVLNQSKEHFDAATAVIEQTPASEMGISDEFKQYMLSIAKKLKPGSDPQKVGMAVFEGCKANLKAI
jgi:hypothetical protein